MQVIKNKSTKKRDIIVYCIKFKSKELRIRSLNCGLINYRNYN